MFGVGGKWLLTNVDENQKRLFMSLKKLKKYASVVEVRRCGMG